MADGFHDKLYRLIDEFVHMAYKLTRKFPKEELFGSSMQLRKAAMSIMLNYQEGYARRKPLVKINFYEISFGSCKESRYVIDFGFKEDWITKEEFFAAMGISKQIASMLWKTIEGIEKDHDECAEIGEAFHFSGRVSQYTMHVTRLIGSKTCLM